MHATVKDAVTTNVAAVGKGTPFKDMPAMPRAYRASASPVLDEHGMVIGVGVSPGALSQFRW